MTEATRKSVRINWQNLTTVGSAAILVGAMILALGFSTAWAVAGALGLGEIATYVVEALFVAAAAAGIVAFWRTATRAEPVVER